MGAPTIEPPQAELINDNFAARSMQSLVSVLPDLDLCALVMMGLAGSLGDEGPAFAAPVVSAVRTVAVTAVEDN